MRKKRRINVMHEEEKEEEEQTVGTLSCCSHVRQKLVMLCVVNKGYNQLINRHVILIESNRRA